MLTLLLGCVLTIPVEDAGIKKQEWTVEGVKREGLVYLPTKREGAPLVFGFHGHGGNMNHSARKFHLHKDWPEAVVVYLQGLNTPGRLTDPEGKKTGWQGLAGMQNDRDLKLFTAVLNEMKEKHKIDVNRIYSTGHSNGGGFTYLLASQNPDLFAAIAPCAAGGANLVKLKPLPVFHMAGEKDPLVTFAMQTRCMDSVKKLNQCETTGKDWGKQCKLYESKDGHPLVTYIHPGGHEYTEETPALVIKFFKQHTKEKK